MPPSTVQAEVAALSSIVDALDPLPQASRSRVLQTAGEWLSTGGEPEPAAEPKQKKPRAKKPKPKRQRSVAPANRGVSTHRSDRLSDRAHAWLTEQSKPQDLLAIADACGTSRGSIYQTIRKDDRFIQVARGEWDIK